LQANNLDSRANGSGLQAKSSVSLPAGHCTLATGDGLPLNKAGLQRIAEISSPAGNGLRADSEILQATGGGLPSVKEGAFFEEIAGCQNADPTMSNQDH
jgi:hypothetical protein